MRVKIECREEDYQNIVELFERMGVEIGDEPTHIFKDLSLNSTGLVIYDELGRHILYDFSDIFVIETSRRDVLVKTKSKTYFTNVKLYEIEQKAVNSDLQRINKSQIISCSKIQKVSPMLNSKLKVSLNNGAVAYVTRTYLHDFKKKIQERGR